MMMNIDGQSARIIFLKPLTMRLVIIVAIQDIAQVTIYSIANSSLRLMEAANEPPTHH